MQKYSKIFGKTQKTTPKDATLKSHQLLYQAGFIRESTAGRYYFLPLGIKVKQRIEQIIRNEMNKTGAQELLTPVLHPLELWKETNRDNSTGFELMQVEDRRGFEFALGGTAEEMIIDLVRKFQLSYKDLPFNVYQFSMKFRDELRARGGLLRVREFTMKDAYSFHEGEKDFKKEYKKMEETYTKVFKKLGLNTEVVLADNGYIGGEYCHEFIEESEAGESVYYASEDGSYLKHEDVATFKKEEKNKDEEIKKMETIDQPEWVQSMEDNKKHYGESEWRYLKNVVYKNRITDEIIVAVIRGDLEVNKTKLEHVLDAVGQLEDAAEDDLKSIGTKPGYVHSWGNEKVKYIADDSLKTVKNFIGGQKEETKDTINVNYGRDFKHDIEADVALAKEGYLSEEGKKLIKKKGVEVGNIFQLGYHYSNTMKNAVFINDKGEEQKYYMGCYGIGIGRTLATIVEKYNDENGIIWPKSATPYHIHFITLGEEHHKQAKEIIKKFESINVGADGISSTTKVEALWDDREDINPGEKFADADLIGIPIRIVLSDRSLKKGGIELKERNKDKEKIMKAEDAIDFIKEFYTS